MHKVRAVVAIWIMSSGASAFAAGNASLVDAVKRMDRAAVQRLVQSGADVNAATADGTTALHWAVQQKDIDTVKLLLRSRAKVNATNRYGTTALELATVNGSSDIVDALLTAGADANLALPGSDVTLLMTAARTGNPATIRTLIAHGADVNGRGRTGQTALMWAAARNNVAAVRTLLEAGASVATRTESPEGARERHGGSGGGTPSIAPEPTGFSAFTFAVRAGQLDAARALLDAGADVNQALSDGTDALLLAVTNAHYEVASILLERGADPNASERGWTALHQIARTRRPNIGYGMPGAIPTGNVDSLDLAKQLIARGADVNARMTSNGMQDGQRNRLNRLGATPFLLAAKSTDTEYMRLLLAAGADPLTPTVDNTTPLMVAAGVAIWNPGEDGGSLVGSEAEVFQAVKMCVELGGDVNARNYRGETAMHGAAFRGANDIVELLVSKGADIDAVAKPYNWTPLMIANGVFYSAFFKENRHTAVLLTRLYEERGLSLEGQVAKSTDCLDCGIRSPAVEVARIKKLEEEFRATYKKAGTTPKASQTERKTESKAGSN